MRTIVELSRQKNYARGFTLIEIIISMVAFAILAISMMQLFSKQVSGGTEALFDMRAAELGQSYLEEILGKRFDENSPIGNADRCNTAGQPVCSATPGLDAGETLNQTSTYDDVDDYNSIVNQIPRDQSGAVRAGYSNFLVSITVIYAGTEIGLPNNTDAKRIDVTITDSSNNRTSIFTAYKTNF